MSALPSTLSETLKVAPYVKHDSTAITPILKLGMSLSTDLFTISIFRSDIDPLVKHSLVGRLDIPEFAENAQRFLVSTFADQPAGRIWKKRNSSP
jgi:hypothetical protein